MEYLALFHTTSGAMRFKRQLQQLGNTPEAMPVPRRLSSSCGIAIKFEWSQDINHLMDHYIEKLYQIENNDYTMIYEGS